MIAYLGSTAVRISQAVNLRTDLAINMVGVSCSGTEESLLNCSFRRDSCSCQHDLDVGVVCIPANTSLIPSMCTACLVFGCVGHLDLLNQLCNVHSSAGCGQSEFQCDNGLCIRRTLTCDRANQCGDFSDERRPACDMRCECSTGMCPVRTVCVALESGLQC